MGEDEEASAGEAGRAAQSRHGAAHGRRHCVPGSREANDFPNNPPIGPYFRLPVRDEGASFHARTGRSR